MHKLPSIVLCRPQNPGNIGSVSRAMSNFGYQRLFLINPPNGWREDHSLLTMSNGYTTHLDNAIVLNDLADLDTHVSGLIGFTRRAGSHRPVIGDLQDAAEQICETGNPEHFALIFGNERTGLQQEELERCDSLYTIPSTPKKGSLNLAMAAGIAMYQIALEAKAIEPYADGSDIKPQTPISASEATLRANELLDTISISNVFRPGKDRRENAEVYLRRILMRARLTTFESNWLQRMAMRIRPYIHSDTNKN